MVNFAMTKNVYFKKDKRQDKYSKSIIINNKSK